jgi:hypothetical protein
LDQNTAANGLLVLAIDGTVNTAHQRSMRNQRKNVNWRRMGSAMIDIPLGKALAAVELDYRLIVISSCDGCEFEQKKINGGCNAHDFLECNPNQRKDGKNVIFKLVDYYPEMREETE